jgi:hypothetical protein
MAIGDRVVSDGVEFEVVWSGGPLTPGRPSKPSGVWSGHTPRLYTKSGQYAAKGPCILEPGFGRVCEKGTQGCTVVHRKPVDNPEEVADDLDNLDNRSREAFDGE